MGIENFILGKKIMHIQLSPEYKPKPGDHPANIKGKKLILGSGPHTVRILPRKTMFGKKTYFFLVGKEGLVMIKPPFRQRIKWALGIEKHPLKMRK